MSHETPAEQAREAGFSRRHSSTTALAPNRGRFIDRKARAEHYRRLRHGLTGSEPFCDPDNINPVKIMGRYAALDEHGRGGKGIGLALADRR